MSTSENSLKFIYFLHISHWILLAVYLAFVFNFKYLYREESKKYVKALNTIYTLGIGLVLISLRYPLILDLRNQKCTIAVSRLMLSAGIIVVSTLRPDDLLQVYNLLVPKTVLFS